MRAFHFTSADIALKILEKQQLKVSQFNDLNDPFELYAMELSNKQHRALFLKFKKRLAAKLGLLCFSEKWKNPLLWSHYADRHKGVALEFEVLGSLLQKVDYFSSRLILNDIEKKISNSNFDEPDVKTLLKTKFKHWKYEEEFRLFVNLNDCIKEEKLYFYKLGNDVQLKGIILGPLCDMSQITISRHLVKNNKLKITKARLAFRNFSVVRNLADNEKFIVGNLK